MLVNPSDLVAKAKATIKECSVADVHSCIGADTLFVSGGGARRQEDALRPRHRKRWPSPPAGWRKTDL